jgi:hypothetical protein
MLLSIDRRKGPVIFYDPGRDGKIWLHQMSNYDMIVFQEAEMYTINIRNIDDSIYEKIKHESKINGLSINKLLLQILDKFFRKNKKEVELHDLDDFFGTWTEEEYRLINEGSEQARKIDEELWR